jgi:predicted GTPase
LVNKIDAEHEHKNSMLEKLRRIAHQYGFAYLEISAKTGQGTDQFIQTIIDLYENKLAQQ